MSAKRVGRPRKLDAERNHYHTVSVRLSQVDYDMFLAYCRDVASTPYAVVKRWITEELDRVFDRENR